MSWSNFRRHDITDELGRAEVAKLLDAKAKMIENQRGRDSAIVPVE